MLDYTLLALRASQHMPYTTTIRTNTQILCPARSQATNMVASVRPRVLSWLAAWL
jgi:hypothetical protein